MSFFSNVVINNEQQFKLSLLAYAAQLDNNNNNNNNNRLQYSTV